MGRPLNIESKVGGILHITQMYILLGVCIVGMILFRPVQAVVGFWPAVFGLVTIVGVFIVYFGLANSRPPNFFFHWLNYEISFHTYVPGYEPIKQKKEKNHGN